LAAKKGVVLIVPHFGTWEVMNAWCAQFTSMTILYKPVKNADAGFWLSYGACFILLRIYQTIAQLPEQHFLSLSSKMIFMSKVL
ncbi:ComEC/Rec2 family competence protein, partial [Acinetobacter baumannii]|uniref:ComEC/Rec2 family competence protein n=1 Tax=Acinetobacter baumannii TaxID=470 RepID=UPI001CB834CE